MGVEREEGGVVDGGGGGLSLKFMRFAALGALRVELVFAAVGRMEEWEDCGVTLVVSQADLVVVMEEGGVLVFLSFFFFFFLSPSVSSLRKGEK